MTKLTLLLAAAAVIALALVGGALYLAYGNFPPPSQPVAKVLPDARFPK